MTNLERARNGERLKVKARDCGNCMELISVTSNDILAMGDISVNDLRDWINKQIDIAVTHAIDETEEPELWRDLKEGEVYQEGDRIVLHNKKWVKITRNHGYIGMKLSEGDSLAQRRVRKEDL